MPFKVNKDLIYLKGSKSLLRLYEIVSTHFLLRNLNSAFEIVANFYAKFEHEFFKFFVIARLRIQRMI